MIEFLLVFCYVFCFSLRGGSGIDSSMLVAAYLILYFLFHPLLIKKTFQFFTKLYFRKIFFLYLGINLWCLLVIVFNGTMDISYMLTFLHMFFLVIVGCLLYLYIDFHNHSHRVVNYLVLAFIAQTIIEWSAFLIPSFKEIINTTKSDETIKKGLSYTGVRANGLSGSDFFGLSAAFALISVVFLSKRNTILNINRVIKFLLFLFLLSGTFFAGRTGFVGLVVIFLFFIYNKRNKREVRRPFNKWERLLLIIFPIFVILGVSYLVVLYNTDNNIYNLFNFAFEAFVNFSENGSAEMSSVSKLENHYYSMSLFTFIFGDGRYMMEDGSYYGSTDVGYMRVVLYMGSIGLLMLILMQLSILKIRRCNEKKLTIVILLLLFILHAKGEVIVWNQIVLDTMMLFSLQNLNLSRQLVGEYENTCHIK